MAKDFRVGTWKVDSLSCRAGEVVQTLMWRMTGDEVERLFGYTGKGQNLLY